MQICQLKKVDFIVKHTEIKTNFNSLRLLSISFVFNLISISEIKSDSAPLRLKQSGRETFKHLFQPRHEKIPRAVKGLDGVFSFLNILVYR